MGFLEKKRKKIKKIPPLLTINFTSITEKMPPNSSKKILTWESNCGFNILSSDIVLQHIKQDIYQFGNPRIKWWANLENNND